MYLYLFQQNLLMEKNAIGQRLETASQTTPATVSGDRVALVNTAKNDELEKMSSVPTEGIGVSTGAGDDVINAADTNTLRSLVPGSNEPVISAAVSETLTLNRSIAASPPFPVVDSDTAAELVNEVARVENIDEVAVAPSPIQQPCSCDTDRPSNKANP